MAEYLVAKDADLNAKNSRSRNSLDLAILGHNLDFSKQLIDKGAKFKDTGVYTKISGFDKNSDVVFGIPPQYSTGYSEEIVTKVIAYAHSKRAVSRTRRNIELIFYQKKLPLCPQIFYHIKFSPKKITLHLRLRI